MPMVVRQHRRLHHYFPILSAYILSFHHDISAYCYNLGAPNPRAIHPDGKLPSLLKARRQVKAVRDTICQLVLDNDDDNDVQTIILVDGNNIRNIFGYKAVSASDLSGKLSSWSEQEPPSPDGEQKKGRRRFEDSVLEDEDATDNIDPTDEKMALNLNMIPKTYIQLQIVCVWDGGSQQALFNTASNLAVFSGSDVNADDVIVQCCAFLSSSLCHSENLVAGLCDNRTKKYYNIVVFTSDANLANRCQLQIESSDNVKVVLQHHIYHSIYLYLLLKEGQNEDYDKGKQLTPDWEREERRESVKELQQTLLVRRGFIDSDTFPWHHRLPINNIHKWINNEMTGSKIGRVTKGGSILYQIQQCDTG